MILTCGTLNTRVRIIAHKMPEELRDDLGPLKSACIANNK